MIQMNTRPRTSRENRAAIAEAVRKHGIAGNVKIGDSYVLAILGNGSSEMVGLSSHASLELIDYRVAAIAAKFKGASE